MADEEKITSAPWVGVPVELIKGNASANAILCFCAMGSFGPESRARVSTIAKRMRRASVEIVRAAQKELLEQDFIRLTAEATAQSPREWILWPYKRGGPENRGPILRGAGNDPPKQIIDQASNNTQATKKTQPSPAIPYLLEFKTQWSKKNGYPWVQETGSVKMLEELCKQGFTLEEFKKRAAAYLRLEDDTLAARAWPLIGLVKWRWNQLGSPAVSGRPKPILAI